MYQVRQEEVICPVSGGALYGVLYLPEGGSAPLPLAVISHGLYSSYLMTAPTGEILAKHGVAAYCFDYRGCSFSNRSGGSMEECSILTEKEEMAAAVRHLGEREEIDASRISLIGQSLGGVVAALLAAERPEDIHRLVLMYPAFHSEGYVREMFPNPADIPDVVKNYMGIPGLHPGRKFFADILKTPILDTIGEYKSPVLFLHGTADSMVPERYVMEAAGRYRNCKYVTVEGGEHGFQIDESLIDRVVKFLCE